MRHPQFPLLLSASGAEHLHKYAQPVSSADDLSGIYGTFSNIGNLIHLMYQQKFVGELIDPEWEKKHPNWNKVVIVPISSNTNISVTTSASIISALSNEMGLSSTQLVGGPNNPIEVKVIYAKFNDR